MRLILGPDDRPSGLEDRLKAFTTLASGKSITMNTIKSEIETTLKDKSYIKQVNHTFGSVIDRKEKVAVRRMMSRYWENTSPSRSI